MKGDERYGEDDPRYALVKEEVQPSAEVTEKQARHQADVDAITASNAAAMEEAAAKHQKDIDTIAARNAAATEAAAPTAAATVHPNQVKKHSPLWVAKHTATPGKQGIHEHSAKWVAKHAADLGLPTPASSSRHVTSLFTEPPARAEVERLAAQHASPAHEKPATDESASRADHPLKELSQLSKGNPYVSKPVRLSLGLGLADPNPNPNR